MEVCPKVHQAEAWHQFYFNIFSEVTIFVDKKKARLLKGGLR
jgi:hypothetical protein